MADLVRILLTGDLSLKWGTVEDQLRLITSVAVARCAASPQQTLSHVRRLAPCLLIADEDFTKKLDFDEFSDAVDFGRSVRVIVEVKNRGFAEIERLVLMGCAGVLPQDASVAMALRAVKAVLAGELWLDRKSVAAVVQNLLCGMRRHLTSRESEILGLLSKGLKNSQIAETLFISPQTVRWHLRSIYSKLGTHDRSCAAKTAASTNHSELLNAVGEHVEFAWGNK